MSHACNVLRERVWTPPATWNPDTCNWQVKNTFVNIDINDYTNSVDNKVLTSQKRARSCHGRFESRSDCELFTKESDAGDVTPPGPAQTEDVDFESCCQRLDTPPPSPLLQAHQPNDLQYGLSNIVSGPQFVPQMAQLAPYVARAAPPMRIYMQLVPSVASAAPPMRIFRLHYRKWCDAYDEQLKLCVGNLRTECHLPWNVMGVKVFAAHPLNYQRVRACLEEYMRDEELHFELSLAELDDLKFNREHGLQIANFGKAIDDFNSRATSKTDVFKKGKDTVVEIDGFRIANVTQFEEARKNCRERQAVGVTIQREKPHLVFATEDLLQQIRQILTAAGAKELNKLSREVTPDSSASYLR